LFAEGWPLTLTAFTLVLYARIDQLMLGSMLGERQVGIYTAATRLSEGLYVVPSLLLASVLPALIGLRRDKPEVYRARLQLLYDALVWGAFGAALLLTLCAGPLIELLFGEAYRASVRVLQVHAWGLLFVFPGTATHRYLMVEGQTRVSLIMSVAGAALNLAANFYLIPLHGVLGAAWATLLSLAAGHVAVAAAFAGPRSALGLFAASLHPVRVARRWHALLRNRI
jgi:PST family polysaccharide transporter